MFAYKTVNIYEILNFYVAADTMERLFRVTSLNTKIEVHSDDDVTAGKVDVGTTHGNTPLHLGIKLSNERSLIHRLTGLLGSLLTSSG